MSFKSSMYPLAVKKKAPQPFVKKDNDRTFLLLCMANRFQLFLPTELWIIICRQYLPMTIEELSRRSFAKVVAFRGLYQPVVPEPPPARGRAQRLALESARSGAEARHP